MSLERLSTLAPRLEARTSRLTVVTALMLTGERLLLSAALMLLTLSSYAWWGNPSTPLAPLWKVSVMLALVWWVLHLVHMRLTRLLLRIHRTILRTMNRAKPC